MPRIRCSARSPSRTGSRSSPGRRARLCGSTSGSRARARPRSSRCERLRVDRRSVRAEGGGLGARLAGEHRATVAAARTLLQQAVPTTFGLRAAGWLVTVLDARRLLARLEPAAQLGGAAGTLAALGSEGPEVLRLFALELELAEPTLPWHANRVPVAELGSALDAVAGALAKIGADVVLLSAFGAVA